jgi:hypothetical protein
VLLLPVLLAGCVAGNLGLKEAGIDPTILTGAVDPTGDPDDGPQLSDQATIRNAVSAADVATVGATPLSWANAETGSRGTISGLVERMENGRLCRSFRTSREAYDGVSLHSGEACMVGPGAWRMERFGAAPG